MYVMYFVLINLRIDKQYDVQEECMQLSVIGEPLFVKHHHPCEQECLLSQ